MSKKPEDPKPPESDDGDEDEGPMSMSEIRKLANRYTSISSHAALRKLLGDLKEAAALMSPKAARCLVDMYYAIQDYRIQAAAQVREASKVEEPSQVVLWLFMEMDATENVLRKALDAYSDTRVVGRWAKTIYGIGEVLSAGLLAHIDIEKSPTVGHIWRFAGLDPTNKWLGKDGASEFLKETLPGIKKPTMENVATVAEKLKRPLATIESLAYGGKDESGNAKSETMTMTALEKGLARRPWNGKLKTLCWKIQNSFVKVCNKQDNPKKNKVEAYGKVYLARKAFEQAKNERGEYADQAKRILLEKNFSRDTTARKSYLEGKLPPGHIQARAERYAMKLFLAHWHHVAFIERFKKDPPLPYAIEKMGHAHLKACPNWPLKEEA